MKAFIILLLLVIGGLLYFMFGPSSSPSKPKPTQTQTQQQQQATAERPQPTDSIRENIDSAMGYGVGYTQMQVKKSSKSKLDSINTSHNKKIEGMQ